MLMRKKEKPFRELFLVGLDIIQDGDEIKILEIQHLFESSFNEATQLTGYSPKEELLKSVLKNFPDWKIKSPTSIKVIREDEILITYPPRVSYLDYCTKAEIDAASAVSHLSLRAVATFARR